MCASRSTSSPARRFAALGPTLRFAMLGLAVVLFAIASPSRAAPPTWDPARTYAVVAGLVTWSDPELAPFSARHRKDKELFDVLGERGVPPEQRRLLLDRQASAKAVVSALMNHIVTAPPGSTFIFYFAGHGVFDKDKRFVMATSDTDTKRLDESAETGLAAADLFPIFALRGASDRVLLMGDACYSGHLAAVAAALSFAGVPAAALTSASELSASSENWTFTQSVIDGLRGRPLIDKDGDGAIALSEVAAEAKTAMRHREGQTMGYWPGQRDPEPNTAKRGRTSSAFVDLTLSETAPWPRDLATLDARGNLFGRGDWVIAKRLDGERGVARVLGAMRQGDPPESPDPTSPDPRPVRLRVEFYDYSDRSVGWAREDKVDPLLFLSYPVGTKLRVEVDEDTYAVRVLRVEDGLHLVAFERLLQSGEDLIEGADATSDLPEDEFVTPDQILGTLDPADEAALRVLVHERGSQTEALLIGRWNGKVCVRYPGASLTDDECVPENRVTPDHRVPDPANPPDEEAP